MKKILIPLGILASLGAILYFKNKNKNEEAQEPDFAPPLPTAPPLRSPTPSENIVYNKKGYPMPDGSIGGQKEYLESQSVAEQKPFITQKEKALSSMKNKLNAKKPNMLNNRDISELARLEQLRETGKESYSDKEEQKKIIQKILNNKENKENSLSKITQEMYSLPEQKEPVPRPMNKLNLGNNRQGKQSEAMIRFDLDEAGNPIVPDSFKDRPNEIEDYTDVPPSNRGFGERQKVSRERVQGSRIG